MKIKKYKKRGGAWGIIYNTQKVAYTHTKIYREKREKKK